MRIIFLSDIHANFAALKIIEAELTQADHIICLGDFVGYGRDVNEVINYIRNFRHCTCVKGNHDYYVSNGITRRVNARVREGIEHAKTQLTQSNYQWLESLPLQLTLCLDAKNILIQHASPSNPLEEYLYPDNPHLDKLFDLDYHVVAFGHTHHPILMQQGEQFILNPGSVGQSRNIPNMACFALYDTTKGELELQQRPIN